MKLPPILILFANLKGNLGDFAILHAMLVELEKRYPGREKHVVSHGQHGVDEARLEAFRKQAHPPFEYKGKTPFTRIPRVLSIFKRIGLERWLSGKLIDRLSARYAAEFPASAAADYEAVFFAGGEQWSGFSNGITMLSVLCAMSRSNQNIAIFPFSVKKKLLQSYSTQRLESCFSHLSGKRVVRDSHSGEIVRQFAPGVVNGADCVFSLMDQAVNLPPAPRPDADAVMLAVTEGDGSRGADLLPVIENLLAAGYRVRLLTTCEREDTKDLRMLSRTLGVEFLAPATWQEVVSEFKASSMVVTNRLHCMIFTFFAGVPLVPLLNREKVVGVFRDAELPHALDHAAGLTPAKVAECLRDEGQIRGKMAAYLEKVSRSNLNP
jgi:polysaccharide pyruvyl transferase WcaK-like protein